MRYIVVSILLSIFSLVIFTLIFGPFGGFAFIVVAAGVIGHQYGLIKNHEGRIAYLEKLQGIVRDDDYNLSDEEIEKELEQYLKNENNEANANKSYD